MQNYIEGIFISNNIILYSHNHNQSQQAELCCSGMRGLLTSDFGSSSRGERHNFYYATPSPTHGVSCDV